ncbi:MAG: Hsp33 family molecular chaperone HslO, partial [Dehalococcoidia bacterium]|nr:Hsp33 family molecular chaperone HslO [Dehalococcoidia bacterium]
MAAGMEQYTLTGIVVRLLESAGLPVAWAPTVTAALAGGADARELARSAAGRLDEGRLLARPVAFRCTCNRRRLSAALVQLGQAELEDMIAKDGRAELVCRFCAKRYLFSSEELAELLARARSGPAFSSSTCSAAC